VGGFALAYKAVIDSARRSSRPEHHPNAQAERSALAREPPPARRGN
jgi:hypothetical protein